MEERHQFAGWKDMFLEDVAAGPIKKGCVKPLLMFLCVADNVLSTDDSAIVFPEESSGGKQESRSVNTPGSDNDVKPRFGFNSGGVSATGSFGVQPTGNGLSATGSFSSSYGNQGPYQGHSGSQSHSFNVNVGPGGVGASQSSSQASSFNAQFPGFYGGGSPHFSGSQASSQSSGFSGSAAGVSGSQAASQTSGFSGSAVGVSGSQAASQSSGFSGNFGGGFPSGHSGGRPSHGGGGVWSGLFNPPISIGGGNPEFGSNSGPGNLLPLEFIRRRRPQLRGGQQRTMFSGVVVTS
ncbi:uncharacterized protein DDB_G0282077 [Anabrus simplex]|uniref:uncharacterized protein DDB_G0282077 n=1 Tax=Anabrus simplex TaxID=316456 RepID=UPI0035A3783B